MSSSMIVIVHVGEPEGVTADYKIDMSAAAKPEPPQEVGQMVETCLIAIRQAAQNIKPGGRFSGISIDLKGMSMPFLVFMEDEQGQPLRRTVVAHSIAAASATVLIDQMSAIYDPVEDFGQFAQAVESCRIIACHLGQPFSRPLMEAFAETGAAMSRLEELIASAVGRPMPKAMASPARQAVMSGGE